MKRCAFLLAGAILFVSLPVCADVPVEMLEAYEDPAGTAVPTHYAPIEFGGSATVVEASGPYSGITFHANAARDPLSNTYSSHADAVAEDIVGAGSPGHGFVTDLYTSAADQFINDVQMPQVTTSSTGPAPGTFDGGAKIINNSYADVETSSVDALRRWDFMIAQADVTFVAAAAIDSSDLADAYLDWSAFDSLAVRGDQTDYSPPGTPPTFPGKPHADLYGNGLASFITAEVSGDAAGLYGNAQAAGQTDALHGVVMRSLLMAGAQRTAAYPGATTVNHLSVGYGAGIADYATSLAILQGGEKTLQTVAAITGADPAGDAVTGTPSSSLTGWAYGSTTIGGVQAVLFHTDNAITNIAASLNWNVTQSQPAPGEIDTTDAGTIFPDLELEVRPLIDVAGQYFIGPSLGDANLISDADFNPITDTYSNTDNVEYLQYTGSLAAGDYAFVISGDPALSTPAALSYDITVVPEPASALMILFAAAPLLRRNHRKSALR